MRTRINLLHLTSLKNMFSVFKQILNSIYIIFQLFINLVLSRFSKVYNFRYRSILSRQHNISESHIAQFLDSVKSNFEFSLILEDDFRINQEYNIELAINTLLEFMKINKPRVSRSTCDNKLRLMFQG